MEQICRHIYTLCNVWQSRILDILTCQVTISQSQPTPWIYSIDLLETSLLFFFKSKHDFFFLLQVYMPTSFDKSFGQQEVNKHLVHFSFWDTSGKWPQKISVKIGISKSYLPCVCQWCNIWCNKNRTKLISVLLLWLVRFLMHQTLAARDTLETHHNRFQDQIIGIPSALLLLEGLKTPLIWSILLKTAAASFWQVSSSFV